VQASQSGIRGDLGGDDSRRPVGCISSRAPGKGTDNFVEHGHEVIEYFWVEPSDPRGTSRIGQGQQAKRFFQTVLLAATRTWDAPPPTLIGAVPPDLELVSGF